MRKALQGTVAEDRLLCGLEGLDSRQMGFLLCFYRLILDIFLFLLLNLSFFMCMTIECEFQKESALELWKFIFRPLYSKAF